MMVGSWRVHAAWAVGTVTSTFVVGLVTFVLGGIVGQQQLYQNWTNRKLDKLESILTSADFEGVETGYSSAAQVYLTGTIRDNAARDVLRNQLMVAFGTEEADAMMASVKVGH